MNAANAKQEEQIMETGMVQSGGYEKTRRKKLIIIKCDSCKKEIPPNQEYAGRSILPEYGPHLCIKCATIREKHFEKAFNKLDKEYAKLMKQYKGLREKHKQLKDAKKEELCKLLRVP